MSTAAPTKRYHVTTFGCQMNVHDSERMKGMMESLGYREIEDHEEADVLLFNTCSIRESADSKLIAHLGHAKRIKKSRPGVVIGVGGCWAQSIKDEVFERFPFVDVAFGPGQIDRLAEFLTSDSLSAQGYFEFEGFPAHLPTKRERKFQGWVQIAVGCNLKCSYCIVPSTRGRESSRPYEQLIEECKQLAQDGVKEITLLGQNVNAYGRDLRTSEPLPEMLVPYAIEASRDIGISGDGKGPGQSQRPRHFAELLAEVAQIDGIKRVRYTSPHPKDIRQDTVAVHAEFEAVCEQIHLPLQSGSSKILKAMRRTYTRERFMDRVAMIREKCPDIGITTDIIVGFPGETEDDFRETLEVCEEVGFDQAFTFIFSARRGTEAAQITEGIVPHPVKVERMQRLVEVVQRRAHEEAQRFVGRELEVLVEGTSRSDPSSLAGRTSHNKMVHFQGAAVPGEIVPVTITKASSSSLVGELSLVSALGR